MRPKARFSPPSWRLTGWPSSDRVRRSGSLDRATTRPRFVARRPDQYAGPGSPMSLPPCTPPPARPLAPHGPLRQVRRVPAASTVADLVKLEFDAMAPTSCGSPTSPSTPPLGKLYCCAVIDAYSRRVVGRAIDSAPRSRPGDQRTRHGDRATGRRHRRHRSRGSWHAIHLLDIQRTRPSGRPASLARGRRPPMKRGGRSLLGPHADRAAPSATIEGPTRARRRHLRIHRRLSQPPPTPLRSRLAHPPSDTKSDTDTKPPSPHRRVHETGATSTMIIATPVGRSNTAVIFQRILRVPTGTQGNR